MSERNDHDERADVTPLGGVRARPRRELAPVVEDPFTQLVARVGELGADVTHIKGRLRRLEAKIVFGTSAVVSIVVAVAEALRAFFESRGH